MASSTVNLILAGEDQGASAALDSVQGGLGGFGDMLGGLANPAALAAGAVGLVTTAAIGAGVALFNASQETEQAMNLLQAQTGATAAEMEQFRGIAENVFTNNWGESIGDVTAAMAEVKEQTGATGAELENLTQKALIMRDVFGEDVAASTNAATVLMEEFGLTGDEAMDFITTGFQRGLNSSDDFLDSIGEYGNLFSDAGFTAEDFFGIMESGAAGGVLGTDKIADAVKEMNLLLNEGGEDMAYTFSEMGLSYEDMRFAVMTGQAEWGDYFDEIVGGINGINDPLAKAAAQTAIFGTMAEDLGLGFTEGLTTSSVALEEMAGATEAAGDAVSQGLGPAWETFKRETLVALMPIGDMIGGALSAATPYLAQFGTWLGTNIPVALAYMGETFNLYWPLIQAGAQAAWDFIYPNILQPLGTVLGENVPVALETLRAKWSDEVFPALQTTAESVWGFIYPNILEPIQKWFDDQGITALDIFSVAWDVLWTAATLSIETSWQVAQFIFSGIQLFFDEILPNSIAAGRAAWETNWMGIRTAAESASGVLQGIFDAVQGFANWLSGHVFNFNFNLPELPDWAIPGSPIPLHTRWADFGDYLDQHTFDVDFQTNTADVMPEEAFTPAFTSGTRGAFGASVSSGGATYYIEKIEVNDAETGRLLLAWLEGIETAEALEAMA